MDRQKGVASGEGSHQPSLLSKIFDLDNCFHYAPPLLVFWCWTSVFHVPGATGSSFLKHHKFTSEGVFHEVSPHRLAKPCSASSSANMPLSPCCQLTCHCAECLTGRSCPKGQGPKLERMGMWHISLALPIRFLPSWCWVVTVSLGHFPKHLLPAICYI